MGVNNATREHLSNLITVCERLKSHSMTHWDLVLQPDVAAECGINFLKELVPAVDDIISEIAALSLPVGHEYGSVLANALEGDLLFDLERIKDGED